MKKLLMFLLVLMILTIAQLTFTAAEDKMPMPDLTGDSNFKVYKARAIVGYCGEENHSPVYGETYIEVNSDNSVITGVLVFYASEVVKTPFAISIAPPPFSDWTVYLDFDQDNIVDVQGKMEDPEIGEDVCHIWDRVKK